MPIEHFRERWHFHQRMNKKVAHNLERLQEIVFSSQSKQEILDALHPWRFSISLRYYNTFSYLLMAASIGLVIFVTLFFADYGLILILAWLIGIFVFGYAYFSMEQQQDIDEVIGQLAQRTFEFQYDLRWNEFPDVDARSMNNLYLLARVRQAFPSLNQGNADNQLNDFAATTWSIDGYDFPVLLFHYIAVDELVIVDKNGREYRKKIETLYWGACIFHLPALALVISRDRQNYERYPIRWKTSDLQFNQHFYVYGQQEFELAKHLTPPRILALAQHLEQMQGSLIFHEQMNAMCYVSRQNIFQLQDSNKPIQDVSQLRGFLRTLQAPHYEHMQANLTIIIRQFKDERLLQQQTPFA